MKPTAIVYTSNTGHTARYAEMLGKKTGLPVFSAEQARKELEKGAEIIYMGWLFASTVKGYKQAAKRYSVKALCGVGLCPTGALLEEIRKAEKLPSDLPLFTLQGGMDYPALKGINKFMIDMLIKGMSAKKERSKGEDAMLALLKKGGDYVAEGNLSKVMKWYRQA